MRSARLVATLLAIPTIIAVAYLAFSAPHDSALAGNAGQTHAGNVGRPQAAITISSTSTPTPEPTATPTPTPTPVSIIAKTRNPTLLTPTGRPTAWPTPSDPTPTPAHSPVAASPYPTAPTSTSPSPPTSSRSAPSPTPSPTHKESPASSPIAPIAASPSSLPPLAPATTPSSPSSSSRTFHASAPSTPLPSTSHRQTRYPRRLPLPRDRHPALPAPAATTSATPPGAPSPLQAAPTTDQRQSLPETPCKSITDGDAGRHQPTGRSAFCR